VAKKLLGCLDVYSGVVQISCIVVTKNMGEIGAVAGGIVGSIVLLAITRGMDLRAVITVQSVTLVVLLLFCFFREKMPKLHVHNQIVKCGIGLLGTFSSFLGIGGGPINVAALSLVLNIELKDDARISIFVILFSQIAGLIMKSASGMIQ